ncbi:MAG: hypothetical protein H0X66_15365 [Verrucomicrobia bacterium]|nr:hypothetical protein [Verrucomicrobiota bacterium]
MLVLLMSLKGMFSTGSAAVFVHLITALLACLLAGIFVTLFFSPRERAWRKWRRRIRKKFGSVEA